jgi:hypothetical protein
MLLVRLLVLTTLIIVLCCSCPPLVDAQQANCHCVTVASCGGGFGQYDYACGGVPTAIYAEERYFEPDEDRPGVPYGWYTWVEVDGVSEDICSGRWIGGRFKRFLDSVVPRMYSAGYTQMEVRTGPAKIWIQGRYTRSSPPNFRPWGR